MRRMKRNVQKDAFGNTRADYEAEVSGMGRFEGEEPYVAYFWEATLHGGAPDEEMSYPEGGGWVGIFDIEPEDRAMFPELKGRRKIGIYQNDQGFIMELKSVDDARAIMKEMELAHSPDIDDTTIHTWFERDRSHVELRDDRTGDTIVEWWDDDVTEAVTDGFLDPKDWHGSAFDYAQRRGLV